MNTPIKQSLPTLTLGGLISLAMLGQAAHADAVVDQLDAGKRYYEAGELRKSIETLNAAVAQIQEQVTDGLLQLLPEPLEGWNADAPESQSGGIAAMITGTNLSRRYYQDDGAEVNLSLMVDSPMMPMLTMALTMPMLMQSSEDTKPYSFQGERGMLEHTKGSDEYKITLMVGNRILVQAEGSRLADVTPVEQYLQALDLKAIQDSLAN